MFRHHGKTRTLSHNKKIASLLSFVAGMVNVAGFLAVQRLTTNVTGHFAFFIDEVFKMNFSASFIYFLYFLSFFLGSFVSNFLIELVHKKDDRYIYFIPTLIEIIILTTIALAGSFLSVESPNIIAITLLFAMGLQNALVTRISGALVRTTHLTGLFTDLGIEISQLLFYKEPKERHTLRSTIKLRFRIILFFFLGGILAGILYPYFHLYELLLPALLLFIGLFYDSAKFQILHWKRKTGKMWNSTKINAK
ncbi:YoaK family protein [Flavobacterium tegetincola]|uniref:YoaK family protein n=1 Tax=Flavobacterium tegetincola TaxID=150172 RepID=UPI00042A89F5|nr:YoaK family protein [Flavobacterium tegetincola]